MVIILDKVRLLFSADRIFARNVVWNGIGTAVPVLAAIVAVPSLIHVLGVQRFGILSLAWVVVGYFSFFDLGLGRAITQLIAQRIGDRREGDIPAIAQTGLALMAILGMAGGCVIAALSPWLVQRQLSIPPELVGETLTSFFLLAGSIPLVILSAGLRGILEAKQRFDLINIVRAPLGAMTYLGPLLVIPFSDRLPPVVAVLAVGRGVSLIAYALICRRTYPELLSGLAVDRKLLREMLSFGGWMTLSNVAGPVLLYAGRVVLAVLVSAEAVAYFSTPYDVVIAVLLIPGIFVGVLFPMFSSQFRDSPQSVRSLYSASMLQNAVIILPIVAIICLFAHVGISFWIGPEFADHSYRAAQLLAIGVLINSFGYYAQALIQAYGRPDLTAKLHVAELVAYIPYLVWLVDRSGVDGAAIAWLVRVTISTIVLVYLAKACLNGAISNRQGVAR